MLILDFNQIVISNLMEYINFKKTDEPIEIDFVRHMVLNTIRRLRKKFSGHTDVIIACDGKKTWRKNIFPYYKASRKKLRQKSSIDWATIFNCIDTIKSELQENFPYKVIHVESAEADDVIAAITFKYGQVIKTSENQSILIVSADKDFIQLQLFSNVQQYDPIKNRFILTQNPTAFLKELVIRGDASDGVPNILSDDDTFVVESKRQKKMTEEKLSFLINTDEKELLSQYPNYKRNKNLIDLTMIPEDVKNQINCQIDSAPKVSDRSRLFNYFVKYKLKNHMQNLGDF